MGIVDARESLSVGTVEGYRIVKPVRAIRRRLDPLDSKLDPVPAGRIDDQHLAVQVQQGVQTRIAAPVSHLMLVISN